MNKRFIVLEVNPQIDLLMNYISWCQQQYSSLPKAVLGRRKVKSIASALINEIVESFLAFKEPKNYNIDIANVLWNTPVRGVTGDQEALVKHIRNDPLFEGIYLELYKQVSCHVESNTYIDWNVIEMGGLLALIEGQDFRIVEYNRINHIQNDDDNAIVAVNCDNIIHYVFSEFYKVYGSTMAEAKSKLHDKIHHSIIQSFQEPIVQIEALFIEAITEMYPMIKLAQICPKVNEHFWRMIGITDLSTFKRKYFPQVIAAFGLSYLTGKLEKGKHYILEYGSGRIAAIYEDRNVKPSENEELELLESLIRGDYLPLEQRRRAEELYRQNSGLV